MKKKQIKEKINDFITNIKINSFYIRHKSKGMTKGYVRMLFNQNLTEVIKDINNSKTKEDFLNIIKNNLERYFNYSLFISIISGFKYGVFNSDISFFYNKNLLKRYFQNEYTKEESLKLIKEYKTIIYEYILNNNKISNSIIRGEEKYSNDFRIDISEKLLDNIFQQIFMDQSDFSLKENNNIEVITNIIIRMQMLYPKEVIFNNKEFVEFEMSYGYFDEYIKQLNSNKEIPTIEERNKIFEETKNITPSQKEHFNNLDLLEERVKNLQSSYQQELTKLITKIKNEKNKVEQAKLLDECYLLYEIAFREEIVDNLYTPTESVEITDFKDLENILVHTFIRNTDSILLSYKEKLKRDIISERKDGNKDENLTPEEQTIYDRKMEYATKVLANPTIVEETINKASYYTDSSGIRSYISDTSNQISTSLFSPEKLLTLGTCVGIGFDKNGLFPENIAISSSSYKTTNMGIENLEIENKYIFEQLSAPLNELEKTNRSEVVLHRKNIDSVTKSSYVFAVLAGHNLNRDKEALELAKKYAEENNMKLVVFNLPAIKKSLEMQKQKEETHTEEQSVSIKM